MSNFKKLGFTLAEVLITLGVVGVVAAMTIPTLISNTQSRRYVSQFKKTLASLNQVAKMSQAQFDVNFSAVSASTTSPTEILPEVMSLTALLGSTLTGETITDTSPYPQEPIHAQVTNPMYAKLSDGSIFIYDKNFKNCTNRIGITYVSGTKCVGYIDVNGVTNPNKLVKDYDFGATEATNIFGMPAYADEDTSTTFTIPNSIVTVSNAQVTDIYPVLLYDGSVVPGTKVVKYLLESSTFYNRNNQGRN